MFGILFRENFCWIFNGVIFFHVYKFSTKVILLIYHMFSITCFYRYNKIWARCYWFESWTSCISFSACKIPYFQCHWAPWKTVCLDLKVTICWRILYFHFYPRPSHCECHHLISPFQINQLIHLHFSLLSIN